MLSVLDTLFFVLYFLSKLSKCTVSGLMVFKANLYIQVDLFLWDRAKSLMIFINLYSLPLTGFYMMGNTGR